MVAVMKTAVIRICDVLRNTREAVLGVALYVMEYKGSSVGCCPVCRIGKKPLC